MTINNNSWQENLSMFMLAPAALVLVGMHNDYGWLILLAGVLLTAAQARIRKHILLLYLSLSALGFIPITTEITNENFLRMGLVLGAALTIPFVITRYVYRDRSITFKFHHGRKWFKKEIMYILVTALIAYLLLPYYLKSTGAYLNWGVENTADSIGRLFIGTNGLGIWDELFFVSTVLGILRLYLPFWQANLLQSVLFTSFLFELGFTSWAPFVLYPFALIQGYIFKLTDSLLYVITIHLTLDFVLFLALLNAPHPQLADYFLY
ncbi:MAG: CPBP family intramembrane glutamic endopeptidase [Patescibacteria group bacterium]